MVDFSTIFCYNLSLYFTHQEFINMHFPYEESYPVTRFALFPRLIQGKWIWLKNFQSDYVLVHGRMNGCNRDVYEYQNNRLLCVNLCDDDKK